MISIAVISLGAALGAVLRWFLSTQLNGLFPSLPPGTLMANLLGGYLIGIAVAYFGAHPSIAPEVRLLTVTGFLGGLTTFSTFSAEVVSLLRDGQMFWAFGAIAAHLVGSLLMTFLGILTVSALRWL